MKDLDTKKKGAKITWRPLISGQGEALLARNDAVITAMFTLVASLLTESHSFGLYSFFTRSGKFKNTYPKVFLIHILIEEDWRSVADFKLKPHQFRLEQSSSARPSIDMVTRTLFIPFCYLDKSRTRAKARSLPIVLRPMNRDEFMHNMHVLSSVTAFFSPHPVVCTLYIFTFIPWAQSHATASLLTQTHILFHNGQSGRRAS